MLSDVFGESAAYERFMGRWSRRLAPLLVEFALIADRARVLDVGTGSGALAAAVAAAKPASHVVGVDRSRAYVRAAGAGAGSGRVRFVVGDTQALPLKNATFDTALSLLVLNFVPDRERALRELIRVTRPGGIIAAAVWDYGGGMEMLRVFWDEAVALEPAIAAKDERHMPLSRSGELAALWRAHGLRHVEEQPITSELSFASFEDYWAPFLGGQGPAGAYAVSLTDDARAALASRLRARLSRGRSGGAFTLGGRAWAVKGAVPPH